MTTSHKIALIIVMILAFYLIDKYKWKLYGKKLSAEGSFTDRLMRHN